MLMHVGYGLLPSMEKLTAYMMEMHCKMGHHHLTSCQTVLCEDTRLCNVRGSV